MSLQAFVASIDVVSLPTSFSIVFQHTGWRAAMEEEMSSLARNQT